MKFHCSVHAKAVGLLVLLLLVSYSRLLVRVDFTCRDDVTEYAIPMSEMVIHELERGSFPWWNPYSSMGEPIWSENPFMGPFYPLFPLYWFLKPGPAVNTGFMLHIIWLALGMYVLLYRRLHGTAAAFTGAALLSMSAHVQMMVNQGYLPNLVSFSYLPWALVAMDTEDPRASRSAVAGVPLALAFLGGHVVNTLIVYLTCFTALFLFEVSRRDSLVAAVRGFVMKTSVVLAVAAILSSILLLPLAGDYLSSPVRSGRGLRPGFLDLYSPMRLLTYGVPLFDPAKRGTEFAGILGLGLAFSWIVMKGRNSASTGGIGLALAALGCLLLTSPSTGLHGAVISKIPVLSALSYTFPFGTTYTFGIAMAAAAGVNAMETTSSRTGCTIHLFMGFVFSFPAISSLAAYWTYGEKTSALAANLAWITITVFAFAVVLASMHKGMLTNRRAAFATGGLAGLELVVYSFFAAEPPAKKFDMPTFFAGGEIARAIDMDGRKGRVLLQQSVTPVCSWAIKSNEGLVRGFESCNLTSKLPPEGSLLLSRSMRGMSLVMDEVAASAKNALPQNSINGNEIPIGRPGGEINEKVLDLACVSYIVLDKDRTITGGIFEPIVQDGTARLWKSKKPRPKARLYRRASVVGRAWLARALANPEIETDRQVVLFDTPEARAAAFTLDQGNVPKGDGVTTIEVGPNEMTFRVKSEKPALVLVSSSYHRDWNAYLDGIHLPVLQAYGAFMAVPIPGGDYELKLRFEPVGATIGTYISVLGWITVLALTARRFFPRRSRPHPGDQTKQG